MLRFLGSLVAALAALLLSSGPVAAGTAGPATPIYHGELTLIPTAGRLNRKDYLATVRGVKWRFEPESFTNGISPSTERIVIALGEGNWALEPGQLVETKRGGVWRYRQKAKRTARAIAMLRLKRETDGSLTFSFRLTGADLSGMYDMDPVCEPFAFIIGDDDAFGGVQFTSPTFNSSKLRVVARCEPGGWPWA